MKKRNKEEWIPLQKTITQKNREEGDADMLLYENTGSYETLHLEISGGYYTLEDIFIHQKINEHTTIKVTAVVLEEAAMEYEQMLLDHQALRLVQKQGEEELVLFGGMIQKLIVERKDGIYYIYVEGISLTKYIDVRKENASYQNENSTYKDVINKALQKYHFSGISYLWTEQSRSKPVGRFLLQFQETDWEFIKRVASIEHLGLIPNMTGRHTQFFIGLPKGREEKVVPPCQYTIRRPLQKAEKEVRNGKVGNIYQGDYLQYTLHNITAQYELGDVVRFGKIQYIVVEKTSVLKKKDGILWNTYVIQEKRRISFPRLYNHALRGNSLKGTVIDVKRNFTKLHLHIDKEGQEVETAFWFPQPQYFTAGSDSGFCIMPERGDMMRLHFPTKDESEHYIICSDNGDFDKLFSCLNASKGGKEPQKVSGPPLSNSNAPYEKYLTTPEGKGMLLNDGVVKYHTTGDISTIQMEDGKGIVISSEGNIEMLANNIVTSSTKQIHMTAGKKIEMISGGSSVIIDGEGNRIDKKAGDIYLESPLNKEMKILTEDEASQILSEAGYSREKTVIGYTPDGIPITPENKFDDAIYNYLYAYWKEHSGEYDPKKDVIPESERNKMHPKTKNEFQFEQWLFEQYGMTSKEKTENTLMGNLNVLLEVSDVIDIVALPVGAIAVGAKLVGKKVIKEVGEKAVKEVAEETVEKTVKREVAEEAVEKTVKTEVSEEVAESTAKKEMADTAEGLSQKPINKNDALENSGVVKIGKILQGKGASLRKSLNDFINSYKQSEEYLSLSNTRRKVIDRKLQGLMKGNVAVADVDIPGIKSEFKAHSKIHSKDSIGDIVDDFSHTPSEKKRIFESYVEDAFPRYNDTEAKILEDIASQIKDPYIKGKINLYTELDCCQSCSNLILEFRRKYPNIKLNIYTDRTIIIH